MSAIDTTISGIVTPGGRRVAIGQRWRDEGYMMRVVAVSENWVWVRHVNARNSSLQTHPAWFDEWEPVDEPSPTPRSPR